MRTSRAIVRNAASIALSNSCSSSSTESLTLFPSRGSTVDLIRVAECTDAQLEPLKGRWLGVPSGFILFQGRLLGTAHVITVAPPRADGGKHIIEARVTG